MSITFPKPNLLKPKIPGVVAIGLLAAQFLLFGSSSSSESKCDLNIENPHTSTYLKEYKNIEAIKINILSKCNSPQKRTDLIAQIETISNNMQLVAYTFKAASALPDQKNLTEATFKNLFVECSTAKPKMYLAKASGHVYLRNGKTVPVSGSSPKFVAIPCRISAK